MSQRFSKRRHDTGDAERNWCFPFCKVLFALQPIRGRQPITREGAKSAATVWKPEDVVIREIHVLRGAHLRDTSDHYGQLRPYNVRELQEYAPDTIHEKLFNHPYGHALRGSVTHEVGKLPRGSGPMALSEPAPPPPLPPPRRLGGLGAAGGEAASDRSHRSLGLCLARRACSVAKTDVAAPLRLCAFGATRSRVRIRR